jgi:DNA-binding CsgD family transcriptional regulator
MSTPRSTGAQHDDARQLQQDATPCNNQKNHNNALRDFLFPCRDLTSPQIHAIDLMLQGLSDAQVAQQLGLDRTTVFRWRKNENVARQLDAHRNTLIQQSTARLQTLLDPALDILQKQLRSDDPKIQVRAAAILVRMATPARLARVSAADALAHEQKEEQDDLNARLDAYINAPLPGEMRQQRDVDECDDERKDE